ncbi:MAG: hypothetical protein ACR2P8_09180 [Myxococcota bacterium]
MSESPPGNVTPLPRRRSRLWREVRRHPYAYILTVVFAAAGAVLAPLLFPAATPWMGLAGGLALGVYAALCTVPNKFLG